VQGVGGELQSKWSPEVASAPAYCQVTLALNEGAVRRWPRPGRTNPGGVSRRVPKDPKDLPRVQARRGVLQLAPTCSAPSPTAPIPTTAHIAFAHALIASMPIYQQQYQTIVKYPRQVRPRPLDVNSRLPRTLLGGKASTRGRSTSSSTRTPSRTTSRSIRAAMPG
jgi:hypothetical protein